ncbi:MAG: TetR/AcrR family transcriptional regulator [Bacteroidota bacterium]
MGRKPIEKSRINNPQLKEKWVRELMPEFFSGQLHKSTMDAIAARLSVSKATFYKHFKSKYEILEAVVDMKTKEIFKFSEVLDNQLLSFEDRFNNAVKVASVELAGITTDFLFYLKNSFEELWQRIIDFLDTVTGRIQVFYQEGIDAGIVRNHDAFLLALTDKIIITSLSDPQFLKDNNLSLPAAIEGYFTIKSYGIFKNKNE